jgi:branched-chain amino acid transport system ATP-binding protein
MRQCPYARSALSRAANPANASGATPFRPDDPMLSAAGVRKDFGGVHAVEDVSFALEPGTITGLIGPNGAGKTTLFNILAGALRPSGGVVRLGSRRIDGLRPDQICRLGVARTFQIPRPFPEMSVLENAMLAPLGQSGERFWESWWRPGRVADEERRNRDLAMHWLEFTGLAGLAAAPARTLSGGQRKLLELARVLVQAPRLILLDEPGAGVAPALLEQIIAKIAELNRRGIGFFIIEHNMDLVMTLCRRVLVMAGGRLLLDGTPDAVRRDPRVIQAYLGTAA